MLSSKIKKYSQTCNMLIQILYMIPNHALRDFSAKKYNMSRCEHGPVLPSLVITAAISSIKIQKFMYTLSVGKFHLYLGGKHDF